ncbi:membrane-associated phospholipid phosphatase [Aequitasia blattaphilus]|uniref:Phosphatase PAP2 family protein n=1 Tax=Aequitasia blattaphilus TaxID=2949332 RepID=A0ABT1E7D3_9FIRM|nr:phosphatase PAP2 family protein [Aequitasia blattaphilus]MCP1101730.1 phosphatase PAP2 family protein [Aequitasia blattaphilus]MCR8614370.1 phosphatase PAP2 family protein [Aequitasia blattaphilus]
MKMKRKLMQASLLGVLFILFTIIMKTIDVRAIGPKGSSVGFATLNQYVFQLFGVNLMWYHITDWLGIVALITAFGFACLGTVQLIKRRGIGKVDKDIIALGIFYGAVIGVYIFFEKWIVNYRPILMNGHLEASYPSSHTMIVFCIMSTAKMQFHIRVKNKKVRKILEILAIALILITIIGRLISGVHWFTDILGGVLLSLFLCKLYSATIRPRKTLLE